MSENGCGRVPNDPPFSKLGKDDVWGDEGRCMVLRAGEKLPVEEVDVTCRDGHSSWCVNRVILQDPELRNQLRSAVSTAVDDGTVPEQRDFERQ